MSNVSEQIIKLTAKTDKERKVLAIIGDVVIKISEAWDDGDDSAYVEVSYKFPKGEKDKFVMMSGDDGWGAVVGAYMSDAKHSAVSRLCVIANFGDEGDCHFVVENQRSIGVMTTLI